MPYIKSDGKRIVIALGGNALGNTPQEQLELVKHTAACIVDMVAERQQRHRHSRQRPSGRHDQQRVCFRISA